MTPIMYPFKKALYTLLSVFFSCAIFANTGLNGVFVKKRAQITGLKQIYVSPSITEKQGALYIIEKTVFNASNFTTAKVFYISKRTAIAKDEKVITTVHKIKNGKTASNAVVKELKPLRKGPLGVGGVTVFHQNFFVIFRAQSLRNEKKAPSFNKPTQKNSFFSNVVFAAKSKTHLASWAKTTKSDRRHFLSSYRCRPPPVAQHRKENS